ncbi:MAG: response regulator [Verrucomicrobia bacterium]|nr:response regulator [Verrucomicrobiota bacterium]
MNKVLIIEDDPVIAQTYRTRLQKEGYTVEVAADGSIGLDRAYAFQPGVVILDLMLAKLNGVEVLKMIRAQEDLQHVPVIVVTNAYLPHMVQMAFAAGATQVFNKATLTARQILEAVANAITLAGDSASTQTAVFQRPPAGPDPSGLPGPGPQPFGHAPAHGAIPPPVLTHAEVQGSAWARAPAASETPLGPASRESVGDAQFQAELVRSFLNTAPETLAAIRRTLQEFNKAQSGHDRQRVLVELFRKVHAVTGNAGIAGLHPISKMAAALEVLLKELYENPKNLNASTLRTVANSIDFIGELFAKGLDPHWGDLDAARILVVDDEILSRRAVTHALDKAELKSINVDDPYLALKLASETAFDLMFLDVLLPGMDGFDLCTRVRALPANKTIPVVFVTKLSDFKSRARSTLSGGTDLIAKPFLFIELSVKALTYVLRGQLAKHLESRHAA